MLHHETESKQAQLILAANVIIWDEADIRGCGQDTE